MSVCVRELEGGCECVSVYVCVCMCVGMCVCMLRYSS